MSEKFSKKQRALLDACAENFAELNDGVPVMTLMGTHEHSLATARSLANKSWLEIETSDNHEAWAYFRPDNYSDYMEMFVGSTGGE